MALSDFIDPAEGDIGVINFDSVLEHIKSVAKQEELVIDDPKDMSKALSLFFLQEYFENIGTADLETSITDGSNDQGIDAVYIEELDDGTNIVNVIQTKLCLSNKKFKDARFSGNEADKLMSKFDEVILNGMHYDHANSRLQNKLDEIAKLDNKKYRIILLTTALPPAPDAVERMVSKVNHYNEYAEYVLLEYIGLRRLVQMLPSLREPKIDFKLRMESNVVDSHAGKARVIVGRTQASRIAKLVVDHKDKLFDKNVRVYLKKKNEINKSIYETATDELRAKYFFILNNGITIVCDKVEYLHGESSPDIIIKGAQIVNGGQTSNSLFEARRDNKLQPTAEVLVRIIETNDKEIVDLVTTATNRQTPVRDPDLHSNDEIQKLLQQYIKDRYGFSYEAKRNEFQGRVPTAKRIDKETATQAYYSYNFGEPSVSKTGKSKLFGEYYTLIFNDDLDKDVFFFSYQLLIALKSLNKESEIQQYGFYRDSLLTSLALMKQFYSIRTYEGLQSDRENGYKVLRDVYIEILESTRFVVEEEIEEIGKEGFEKRRLFIAPTTFGRIDGRMISTRK